MSRSVSWSGYDWKVRGVQASALPGPNAWSDSTANVTVSDGTLQIAVVKSGADYTCSEIELEQTLGYGRYSFVVSTNLSGLDPWAVLGIYTYDAAATGSNYREIDIEAAKWGSSDTDDLQFTVQPGAGASVVRFPASSAAPYTLEWTWAPDRVRFEARDSGGSLLRSRVILDGVPASGAEHLYVNAWLSGGHAPDTGASVLFELASFTFTPSAESRLLASRSSTAVAAAGRSSSAAASAGRSSAPIVSGG